MAEVCVFCGQDPLVGSEEHVFLAALGGRVATRHAICLGCNNHFSNTSSDDIDGALATSMVHIRNALNIWSGRGKPPPTIPRAGVSPSGVEYDLAPGGIPISRPATLPKKLEGGELHLKAANIEDAKRIADILEKRGHKPEVLKSAMASEKVGVAKISFSLDLPRCIRSLGKTAVTGACLLHGNEATSNVDTELRRSIYGGEPDISAFGWWDFVNEWPTLLEVRAHRRSPEAVSSAFDHALVLCDVGAHWVAYVTIFGSLKASFRLGPATGLPARGFACNPRVHGRLGFDVVAPKDWSLRTRADDGKFIAGMTETLSKVGETWQDESLRKRAQQAASELAQRIMLAGDDEEARSAAIVKFSEQFVTVEAGHTWQENLDPALFDD